jgi:hypothetical protein
MQKYGAAPAEFVVYVDAKPQKGKPGEAYTSRMGGYRSLEEAKRAVAKNEREMTRPNSYGGLIDWGDDRYHRHYRIFEATYNEIEGAALRARRTA